MVSITFSISEETRKLMKDFPEVNWTHIVRSSIEDKAKKLSLKKEIIKKLKSKEDLELSDWSVEFGRKAKKESFDKLNYKIKD